ncbi:Dyp-type peroxidase [Motilibacter sp. K478]|nr:Dyp-type peroxidase [Motilibacter aurantiacus]NHC44273.1 Dyp-type peroxidase [Motilibacter aurantiacus]
MSRRQVLLGGAAAGVGAAVSVGGSYARAAIGEPPAPADPAANGRRVVPFHGEHQAGVEMKPQAHQSLVSLTLDDDVDRDGLQRLLRILTDDAHRATQGFSPLADSEPELAVVPAGLTVTFGFGPRLVERARPRGGAPAWLRPLPPFGVDRLEERWNGGDLLLQIATDDPVTLSHTQRMLLKDARSFAKVTWVQTGFRRAHASQMPGTTMRNLLGQVDGTTNPVPGTADFADLVWNRGEPEWMAGGTSLVVRRIALEMDKWDRLDRSGREEAVGRTLRTGAPLTGGTEHDEPDFEAKTTIGFPRIAEYAHIRRARMDDTSQRIFRRGYNYDLMPGDALVEPGSVSQHGLIFTSFQRDPDHQFVPMQRRLAELDLLNEWTIPIGSAVFAIPPGCADGGFIGETMF